MAGSSNKLKNGMDNCHWAHNVLWQRNGDALRAVLSTTIEEALL